MAPSLVPFCIAFILGEISYIRLSICLAISKLCVSNWRRSSKIEVFPRREGAAAILAAILEFIFTRYFFHPENDFNGFLDRQNLGKDTKFITPRQM